AGTGFTGAGACSNHDPGVGPGSGFRVAWAQETAGSGCGENAVVDGSAAGVARANAVSYVGEEAATWGPAGVPCCLAAASGSVAGASALAGAGVDAEGATGVVIACVGVITGVGRAQMSTRLVSSSSGSEVGWIVSVIGPSISVR